MAELAGSPRKGLLGITVTRLVLLLVSMLVAIVAAVTSCSSATGGSAVGSTTASDEPTTGTTTPRSTRTTGSSPSNPGTGSLPSDPCSLLSQNGQAQLGISNGQRHDVGEFRGCRWRLEGPTLDDSFTLDVVLIDKRGLKDVVSNDKRPITVGSHEAVRYAPTAAGCAVAIGVTSSSRVDTQAVGGNDQKACDIAVRMANLVEPELP